MPVCRVQFGEKQLDCAATAGNLPPGALRFIKFKGAQFFSTPQFAGDHTARVTPVPIPNTEVKPRWADGTARESVWEIR